MLLDGERELQRNLQGSENHDSSQHLPSGGYFPGCLREAAAECGHPLLQYEECSGLPIHHTTRFQRKPTYAGAKLFNCQKKSRGPALRYLKGNCTYHVFIRQLGLPVDHRPIRWTDNDNLEPSGTGELVGNSYCFNDPEICVESADDLSISDHIFFGPGVYDAIITFNNGNLGRLEVFKHLGISDIGSNTIDALKVADKARIRKSEYAEGLASKESRVKRRRERLREEEVDDIEYCPGGFSKWSPIECGSCYVVGRSSHRAAISESLGEHCTVFQAEIIYAVVVYAGVGNNELADE
ncbi:hypothetical protein J6590_073565 [Homalodisca vitripennis]|nr:hypothetical protein J6590_073565 [Homalodisca vitripennis]